MITVRRHSERRHRGNAQPETWQTFHALERAGVVIKSFCSLAQFDEFRLPPGAQISAGPRHGAEKLTYVCEGAVSYRDDAGQSGVLLGGEFQCRTSARGIDPAEHNPSRGEWSHVFQVWLGMPTDGTPPGHEERRFSAADRRGKLCTVASPDGRDGSLSLHEDALMYSSLLDEGQHLVHALQSERSAWLHLIQGTATVEGVDLTAGDGIGVESQRVLSVTATSSSELLLFDLPSSLVDGAPSGPAA